MNKLNSLSVAARCGVTTLLAATILVVLDAHAEVTSPVLAINAEAAKADVTVQPLRGNVSVLFGSGGNIGVYAVPEGKFMVDAGIAVSRPRVEAALKSINQAPPKWLVNTHWHWDHSDGNGWMHQEGATVVAQENVLNRLADRTRVIEWGYTFPPMPPGALPTVTYKDAKTIQFGGETIELNHYGNGHTDGDTVVYFRNADILQMGDIFWNGHYPFIDYGAGGSINDTIRWTQICLDRTTAHTIIIPGHGAVGSRADLQDYHDMLVAVRDRVARQKGSGASLAEIVATRPTAEFDAKYGDFVIDPAFFTLLVYMGV